MHPFFLASRTGWFAEGRFLGRVLDEWVVDAQEFIRIKLPHLLVIAVIAFLLNRILRAITSHMTLAAKRSAASPARLAQVRTLAGIIRTTGLAIIGLIAGLYTVSFWLPTLLREAGIRDVLLVGWLAALPYLAAIAAMLALAAFSSKT